MNYNSVTVRQPQLIDRSAGYFTLPAFTYAFNETGPHAGSTDHTVDELTITADINDTAGNPLMWNGASQRITQWNYASTNNFVLVEMPEAPEDPDFCLCIAFRVGSTVYRYKLWEGVGEILNAPLYTGQVIKKNFSLEVWSTETTNEVNLTTPILLSSSIRAVMTDSEGLYEVVAGVESSNQLYSAPTITLSTTNLVSWYRGDVSQLTVDAVGVISSAALYAGSGSDLVADAGLRIADADELLAGHSFPEADTVKGLESVGTITAGRQWILLLKVPTGTSDGEVIVAPGLTLEITGGEFDIFIDARAEFNTQFALTDRWILIQASITAQGTETRCDITVTDFETDENLLTFSNVAPAVVTIPDATFQTLNCYFADFITFSDTTDTTDYVQALKLFYGFWLFESTLDTNTVLVDNP